jgi:hypothetical protein
VQSKPAAKQQQNQENNQKQSHISGPIMFVA